MKILKLIIYLFIPVVILFGLALPVSGYLTEPTVNIYSLRAYRNLAVPGDQLYVWYYSIHTDNYTTSANDAIIMRLQTNSGTLLGVTSPYPYFYNGWEQGISAIYFSAATAPDWGEGQGYVLNIDGTPAYYDSYTPYNREVADFEYSASENTDDNQAALGDYITSVLKLMENYYTTVSLVGTSSTGQRILSDTGENYINGAVPGMRLFAPDIFLIQAYAPAPTTIAYSGNQTTVKSARFHESEIYRALEAAGAKWFHISAEFLATIIVLVITLAIYIGALAKGFNASSAMLGAGICLTGGGLIVGATVMLAGYLMAFIGVLLLAWSIYLKRA